MLCCEACQWDGQIESQSHVASPVVLELIKLSIRFFPAFATEYFQVLEGGGVDRAESVGAIYMASGFDQLFTRDHGFREVIPKALERARLDKRTPIWFRIVFRGRLVHEEDEVLERRRTYEAMTGKGFGRRLRMFCLSLKARTASAYSSTCSGVSKYFS